MVGIFTKRIWQPCICQPNELKREIKKKTGGAKAGAKQKSGGPWPTQAPPLESPLHSHHCNSKGPELPQSKQRSPSASSCTYSSYFATITQQIPLI